MKKHILILLAFPFYSLVFSQSVPSYVGDAALEIKNPGKFLLDEFVRIEGGNFLMQGNATHSILSKQVTINSFYMQDREVTNLWYKLFLYDIARKDPAEALRMMPDTSVWVSDFSYSYNEPLKHLYFSHKAYNNYPVVGVNYKQALAFAAWANEKLKAYLTTLPAAKQLVGEIRLPNSAEWQYAAAGGLKQTCYGLKNESKNLPDCTVFGLYDDTKKKFRANYKNDDGLFILDGQFHTGPVKSFPSNAYGLYDMVGNVSEWVSDAFVFFEKYESQYKEQKSWTEPNVYTVSGGSWCDDYKKQYINTVNPFHADSAHSYIGFRLAASVK